MTTEIHVRLFGSLRDRAPKGVLTMSATSVAELRQELARLYPDAGEIPACAIASDSRVLGEHELLSGGSSVAVLPPVCGG